MIDLEFLERLIAAIDRSSIDSIEIERGGTRVRLGKTPPQSAPPAGAAMPMPAVLPQPSVAVGAPAAGPANPASAPPETESPTPNETNHLIDVVSPMVGTFYRAPSPESPPFVEVGTRVSEGTTLCIIEAMKLMNELEAEVSGTIAEICVENAEPVEYGQVLFRIDPT